MTGSDSCSSAQRLAIISHFTGKERDAETGLDYFGARYFSSPQGRFTSPDLIIHPNQSKDSFAKFISDPGRWNKYVYVSNNPLKYVDPLGLEKYFAILINQPLPGKNVPYNERTRGLPDVGHTSFALIDTDRKSFVIKGFYPEDPEHWLPPPFGDLRQPGRIKDDKDKLGEVDAAFFFAISDDAFQNLTKKVKNDSDIKNTPAFDLRFYNCTDYAITLAWTAGIPVHEAKGPFGKNGVYGWGNNPNMFGNKLDEEYYIYQQKVEEDEIRKLKKMIGIK
jgi:RHS repeat-associated protein